MTTYAKTVSSMNLSAAPNQVIENTWFKVKGNVGLSGSMKAGYVDGLTLRKCKFSGDPDTSGPTNVADWGTRLFNLRNTLIEDLEGENIRWEHLLYLGRAGGARIQRIKAKDIGSQLIQDAPREIDSVEGRKANVKCLLELIDIQGERIGTSSGRRQSWNITLYGFDENLREYYPDGPLILDAHGQPHKGHFVSSLTDVVASGLHLTGYGYPHLASGNRQCDSTGGLYVGHRENFELSRSFFHYTNPDREIICFTEVKDCRVKPINIWGGDIVLHDMDNCKVNIAPCFGDGDIRRRNGNDHTSTFICKVTAGYSH